MGEELERLLCRSVLIGRLRQRFNKRTNVSHDCTPVLVKEVSDLRHLWVKAIGASAERRNRKQAGLRNSEIDSSTGGVRGVLVKRHEQVITVVPAIKKNADKRLDSLLQPEASSRVRVPSCQRLRRRPCRPSAQALVRRKSLRDVAMIFISGCRTATRLPPGKPPSARACEQSFRPRSGLS